MSISTYFTVAHTTTRVLLYLTLSALIYTTNAFTPTPTTTTTPLFTRTTHPLHSTTFSSTSLIPVTINPKQSQHVSTAKKHLDNIIGGSILGLWLLAFVVTSLIIAYKKRKKRMQAHDHGRGDIMDPSDNINSSIFTRPITPTGAHMRSSATGDGAPSPRLQNGSRPPVAAAVVRPNDTGGVSESDVWSSHSDLESVMIMRGLGRRQWGGRQTARESVLSEQTESGRGGSSVVDGHNVGAVGATPLNPATYLDGAATTERGH